MSKKISGRKLDLNDEFVFYCNKILATGVPINTFIYLLYEQSKREDGKDITLLNEREVVEGMRLQYPDLYDRYKTIKNQSNRLLDSGVTGNIITGITNEL